MAPLGWQLMDPNRAPASRLAHAAVWDRARCRMVAFGGIDDVSDIRGDINVYRWKSVSALPWPDEACDNGLDDDGDDEIDCHDPDCEGRPCPGGLCLGGSCQ